MQWAKLHKLDLCHISMTFASFLSNHSYNGYSIYNYMPAVYVTCRREKYSTSWLHYSSLDYIKVDSEIYFNQPLCAFVLYGCIILQQSMQI